MADFANSTPASGRRLLSGATAAPPLLPPAVFALPHALADGAKPIPLDLVIQYLALHPREAARLVAGLADALIIARDDLTPDPDSEPDEDFELTGDENEPSLGAPENCSFAEVASGDHRKASRRLYDQTRWGGDQINVGFHDLEAVNEDGGDINDGPQDGDELECDGLTNGELDESERECSLGSLDTRIDQRGWATSGGDDREKDAWRRPRRARVAYPESPGTVASRAARELRAKRCPAPIDRDNLVPLWPGVMLGCVGFVE